jgi:ABC-type Fe3+/spermidine/putrescine transport system ATPase subunit
VYFKPENKFVADFVGVANFIDGEVVGIEEQDIIVKSNDTLIRVNKGGYTGAVGQTVSLVIRPECISINEGAGGHITNANVWSGVIQRSSFLGRMVRYWVEAGPMQWILDDSSPSVRGTLQGIVNIALDKNKIHILPKA